MDLHGQCVQYTENQGGHSTLWERHFSTFVHHASQSEKPYSRQIGNLLFPSDSSNTDEGGSEDEFYGFEFVTESNTQNTRNSAENPDDPQPSTSGAGPSHSHSGVPQHKCKLMFSRGQDSDVSSGGDDSDVDSDFLAFDYHSSSDTEEEYSPVKRRFIRRMRSSGVPYAVPREKSTSCGPTPGTDSESDDDIVTVGMDNIHGAVGGSGSIMHHAAPTAQPRPVSTTHTPQQTAQPPPPVNIQYPPADRIWDWQQGANFVPNPHHFDETQSGIRPSCTLGNNATELECFELFFDEPLMEIIVRESNTYFDYTMANTLVSPKSRLHQWKETTVAEMYLLLATIMVMPHVYKHNVKSYWSTDRLISTPAFSDIMSVNRFVLLLRMLHFSDKTRPDRNDRLYKIRNVFMYLKQKFSMYFYPFRKLVIGESLILFKGRQSFKHYIPSKKKRFGIKLFVLCDCYSGLVLDIIVYTGSNTLKDTRRLLGISGDVARTMMEPYLGKGHTLYTDNWYTSPLLSDFLRVNMTDMCGTVHGNRKHMPKFSTDTHRGEVQVFAANDIMAFRWHDKRDVTLLTSVHQNKMTDSGRQNRETNKPILKPAALMDYTLNMYSVNKCDVQIGFADCVRKSYKWYMKLFFHLVDISMLNAYNMYKMRTRNKPPYSEFCLSVIRQIIFKYQVTTPAIQNRLRTDHQMPSRLRPGDHFLIQLPSTKKKSAQKRCFVCAHTTKRPQKRRDTRFMCEECKTPLCITPCFKEFHKLQQF
ncbi:piggyBac transposable element-derived protein 4 [Cherax quadricarinatus]|uniref:piggyBac transposable element-derived protein 4 n=1 Tax=Cherax quadricarinatus TaxID=27406 RepID=UPI0023790B32|nr:piggyBac transposable element-derived protein 4-like [Cherax quadricarinatus]